MKDIFTRILNAAVAGKQVMEDNSALWSTKTAIDNKKTALDTKINEIGTIDDNITDGSGLSSAKSQAKITAALSAW